MRRFIYFILIIFTLSSCSDEDENQVLEDTVWIHRYTPEDNVQGGVCADAYVFYQKGIAQHVGLDKNMKIIRTHSNSTYQVKGNILIIGAGEHKIEGMSFHYWYTYYKSNYKPTDLI